MNYSIMIMYLFSCFLSLLQIYLFIYLQAKTFEILGLADSYNHFFVAFTLYDHLLAVIYGSLTLHFQFQFGTACIELNQKLIVLLYFQWR